MDGVYCMSEKERKREREREAEEGKEDKKR